MARSSKCTPELQMSICTRLECGIDIELACRREGISSDTYYEWMRRGRAGEQPYEDFVEAVEVARAECEIEVTRNIIRASRNRWQAGAWWIKWRHSHGIQKVELTGKDGSPIAGQLTPEGADMIRQRILYGDRPPKQLAAAGGGGSEHPEISEYEQPAYEVRVDDDEDEP